jgi:hypothetical protein
MHPVRWGAFALLVVAARPALGQADTANLPARILSHTFTTPSREFVRVRLLGNVPYRVLVTSRQVKLEVRPVSQGIQPPVVRRVLMRDQLAEFLLRPRVTSEYEIRILGGGPRPVTLTIDRIEVTSDR